MSPIKICALTGIRSEYDILYPVLDELRRDERFDLKVIVSGAHLSDWHGHTIDRIRQDDFEICDCIDSLFMTDRRVQRAKGVGVLTTGLAQTLERENPHIVLVVGDREESLAAALVCNYMNILLAHIAGGDPVFGNADDPVRFAVSKLAHIHLTFAEAYGDNLKRAGEEDFRIFNVGNPSLDNIRVTPHMDMDELSKNLGVDVSNQAYGVLIFHPLSSEMDQAGVQIKIILETLKTFSEIHSLHIFGSYPNTDPGAADILTLIKEYDKLPQFTFSPSLPREVFINMMRHARVLIGNSSMGLLEAPFYGLPVINVGGRQRGRLNAGNVAFVPFDEKVISQELTKSFFDTDYIQSLKGLKNPFGDGHASSKIRDALLAVNFLDDKWYTKRKLC